MQTLYHGSRVVVEQPEIRIQKFHKDFDPFAPGFFYAEPGNICELEKLFAEVKP